MSAILMLSPTKKLFTFNLSSICFATRKTTSFALLIWSYLTYVNSFVFRINTPTEGSNSLSIN